MSSLLSEDNITAKSWKSLTHLHSERPKEAWRFWKKNYLQKQNIWRSNVDQKPKNNSPSNILWTFGLTTNYFQKYESSRQYILEKLWVFIG